MDSKSLKKYLYKNKDSIITLLESLDCHSIKEHPNRYTSALPEGDNINSVNVMIDNDNLTTIIHTRGVSGDIITLVEHIKGYTFNNAMGYICEVCKIPSNLKVNHEYDFLDKFCKLKNKCKINYPLPPTFGLRFIECVCPEYLADGVKYEIQKRFGVCYDIFDSRIVIPIKDIEGNIVSYKGRTINPLWEELEIPKFFSYANYYGTEILFGYYENYFNILSKGEVILVESEKGVMQGASFGQDNVLALSKKKLSPTQIRLIRELNVDVVFALDNDVPIEEVKILAESFDGLCNCYYVGGEPLKGKESPFDKGEEVWYNMYQRKVLI